MKWFMPDSHPDDRARLLEEMQLQNASAAEMCVTPGPLFSHRLAQAKAFYTKHRTMEPGGTRVEYPLSEVMPDEDWQMSHPRCCE
jgi:hypothetical protein